MGTPTSKEANVKAGLSRMARVSRWGGASVEASPKVSRGDEASDGASLYESRKKARRFPGWWS